VTYEFALAAAWPGVVPVARRELWGFHLSPETVEDLIQEAATVVLRKRPPFEGADDLAPYIRVVVRRLALHWLRDHRRESIGAVPDRPALHAVPELVEGRLRLAGTMHAFSSLQPGQRALLSDYISDRVSERAADRRAGVRERKQVQRLRMAMARVADGFAAALGWLRLRFPWLEALPAPAIAAGFALSALLGALAPPSHGEASSDVVTAGPSGAVGSGTMLVPAVGGAERTTSGPTPIREAGDSKAAGAIPTRPESPAMAERIRVETPVGRTVGWEQRPNGPDKNLVCANPGTPEPACVEKVPFPTVPRVPSLP
jgi:DNA-directed RNA polymerase specialized sigma24 family protein